MRVLANCMAFLIVGCTLPNPAFETGDGVADDTRGKDSGTLDGTSVGESGDAEASSSVDGSSSSVGESTDAETTNPSTTNGESSSSTTNGESSSSTTNGESSSSTTNGESSSSTDGESSSSTTDMSTSLSDSSSDGLNECPLVPTGNDCLDCVISEPLCCDIAVDCIDPQNGCGCLILCQLQNTDCNACGNNVAFQQLKAGTVVDCISNVCDNFCL